MRELSLNEIEAVSGADAGAVTSCVAVGTLGLRAGVALGPWGAAGGAALGCAAGVFIYSYF